jgi:hypothetical protein
MSWTYDPTQLQDSALMQVRLVLGDTAPDDPLMEDEEIQFYLDQTDNSVLKAAINCIDAALARISAIPNYKLGPYQESTENRIAFLTGLRRQLEEEGIKYNAPLAEKPTTTPIFRYDMMSPYCRHGLGGDDSE